MVIELLVELARQRGALGVLLPFLRDDELNLFDSHLPHSAAPGAVAVVGAGCRARTDVPLQQRRARSRTFRRAHDRYLRRRADGEVHELVLGAGEQLTPDILCQTLDLLAHDAARRGVPTPPRRLHAAILGDWPTTRTVQWTTRPGETVITGVEIGIVDGRDLVAKFGGHRERDRGYLDIGLTGSIDLGYRLDVDVIDLGPSTHVPKLERGCEVYWVYAALLTDVDHARAELTHWMARYESIFVPHLRRLARHHGHTATPPASRSTVGGAP